ncbi:MAG: hypothetical protein J6Y02_04460 [Pseudobutyrivibrio sp.]|nr:hypothetical protein [Pseudobutyrivibrio sp.]
MANIDFEKKLVESIMHLELAVSRNPMPQVKNVAYTGKAFIKELMNLLDFNKRDPYNYVPGVFDLEKAIEDLSGFLEKVNVNSLPSSEDGD